MKTKQLKKLLLTAAMVGSILNLTSCGTWIHPERMGQISGRIDPGIAILDGIGLLFFIIPGVIAFAVDFSNGTIYLPPDGSRVSMRDATNDLTDMGAIETGKRPLTNTDIEIEVRDRTGKDIDLKSPNVQVTRMDGEGGAPFQYRSNPTS
jgi:hypothetical protein